MHNGVTYRIVRDMLGYTNNIIIKNMDIIYTCTIYHSTGVNVFLFQILNIEDNTTMSMNNVMTTLMLLFG